MSLLVKRHFRYDYLSYPCYLFFAISRYLQFINPHPYRGLIGNIVFVVGILLAHTYAMKYRKKTIWFNPDKNNHTLNWTIFIILAAILVFMFGVLVFVDMTQWFNAWLS